VISIVRLPINNHKNVTFPKEKYNYNMNAFVFKRHGFLETIKSVLF